MAKTFVKDKDALLDYKWDWSEFLGTDQIVSAYAFVASAALAQTSGLRVANMTVSGDNGVVVWLSGGVEDTDNHVTVRIWSSGGRRNDECAVIYIEDCS